MPPDEKEVPIARGGARLTAVLGPTNTGKTHLAVERMLGHASGMIGLPLRLLAREIYDRVVAQKGPEAAALITGEEKIVPAHPRYFICTVEAMPLERRVSFLAIDEIQLCADPERGHVFTDRLLRARGDEETMFLGAETMRPVIRQLIPDINFINRTRFSDLTYIGPKKLARLPRRSAVVAFSAAQVYGLAELIRSQRGGAAVVMGALSPRTRNAQVALYQSGEVDFLVATDAIGMGLNMDVDHVAFASLTKFDGQQMRALKPAEIGQIAGRAGRHMNDGTFGPTGECAPFDAALVEQIEQHRFDPVRVLQWRNPTLEFASVDGLIRSLELPPPAKGLSRARSADDLAVLRALAAQPELVELARSPDDVRLLWDVCQIPDFRKATLDEHARLLCQIFSHLIVNENRLPTDWVASQVERIDVTAGDIDTLSARLAQIRVWTYIAHRAGWLADAAHWQERTRAIEDALSDALHEALTLRFIDRRASVLMRRLAEADDLNFTVDPEGDVTIEGQYAGRLNGFIFEPDPRGGDALSPRTLRHAAARALGPEIAARAGRLASAAATQIQLSEHGKIWWEGGPVAKLIAGGTVLSPKVEILADDLLPVALRERAQGRLDLWVREHIAHVLAPLASLAAAQDLEGLARGLAYQLVEQLGSIPRTDITDAVRGLDQPARAALRRYGVRFGAHSVFLPALIKPAAAQLKVLLWSVAAGAQNLPSMPAPGLVSVPIEPGAPPLFYERAGFRPCGLRAVRVDMLERLADMLRPPRRVAPVTPVAQTPPETQADSVPAGSAMSTDSAAETEIVPEGEPAAVNADVTPEIAPPIALDSARAEAPPAAAPQPEPQPGPVAADGSFTVTADMMSIVGASGPEFEALLRSLGFRPRQGPDGRMVWRMGRRHENEAQQGRPPRGPKRPAFDKDKDRAAPGPREQGPREQGPREQGARDANAPSVPRSKRFRPEQASRRRDERKEGGKTPDRPPYGGQPHVAQAQRPAEKPKRAQAEKQPDPNSPFAKLAILKQAMTKGH